MLLGSRSVGLAVGTTVLTWSFWIRAEPAPLPLTITWKQTAQCNVEARVVDSVTKLVGDARERAPAVAAEVELLRQSGEYLVRLRTEQLGESGQREFRAKTCAKAADALALVLSVMLSPPATTETVKDEGFPGGAKPTPSPPATRETPPARAAAPTLNFSVGPRLGGDVGSLPKPTLFAGGAVALSSGRFRIVGAGAWWVPRTSEEGPRPDTGAVVGLLAGSVSGCFAAFLRPLPLEGCAGLEVGRVAGEGVGLRNPRETEVLWLAALPSVTLRAPNRILPASLSIQVPVPVVRSELTIDGFGEVYRASPVALRAILGADWVF